MRATARLRSATCHWAITAVLVMTSPAAFAGIYKCQDMATGEIEFKDSPCSTEQSNEALPDTLTGPASGGNSEEERSALEAIIDEDRDAFQSVCEGQIDRESVSDVTYRRRCESALRKQAQCKMDASRMFPEKVHAAFVGALAGGMNQAQARDAAKDSDNWDGMTTEEAMVFTMPIAEFTSTCVRAAFD